MVSPALFEGDRLPLARPNGVIEYRGEQHHYIATHGGQVCPGTRSGDCLAAIRKRGPVAPALLNHTSNSPTGFPIEVPSIECAERR